MLCVNCGADVGEQLRECERCQALKKVASTSKKRKRKGPEVQPFGSTFAESGAGELRGHYPRRFASGLAVGFLLLCLGFALEKGVSIKSLSQKISEISSSLGQKKSSPLTKPASSKLATYSPVNRERADTLRISVQENSGRQEKKKKRSSSPKPLQSVPHGLQGYAEVDGNRLGFGSVIALYHQSYNRVELRFYQEDLSEAEKQRRAAYLAVTKGGIEKPNLVMNFNFWSGLLTATSAGIRSYHVDFIRNEYGSFYFPGVSHIRSFSRKSQQVLRGDIEQFQADLKPGGKIVATLGAFSNDHMNGTDFRWAIRIDTKLYGVR